MRSAYLVLNGVSGRVQKVMEFIAALCSLTGLAAVFFQVIYRYVIVKFVSFSFPFTEEYARFTTVWMTYLCAGVCMKEGYLVSLNLVYDRLPKALKHALYYATRILIVVFLGLVIYYTCAYLPKAALYTSPVVRLSGLFLYSMPIVGSALMLFELAVETLGVVCGEIPPFGNRSPEALEEAALSAAEAQAASQAKATPDARQGKE